MHKTYLYVGGFVGVYLLGLGLGVKLAKEYYSEKADREITETRLYMNEWYNEMPDPEAFHAEMSRQYGMSLDEAVDALVKDHRSTLESTDEIITKLEAASEEVDGEIDGWSYANDYHDYTKTNLDLYPKTNLIREDGVIIPESDWSEWFPKEFIREYRQSGITEAVFYRNHALKTDFEIIKNFDRVV